MDTCHNHDRIFNINVYSIDLTHRQYKYLVEIMSLKITHSVVIVMSIMLTAYFSFAMSSSNIEYSSTFSILSAFLCITLVYYLFSIIKKFQVI